MGKWIIAVVALLVLSGCGKDPISQSQARSIAALSQDADLHLAEFTRAIQELSTKDRCQVDEMRNWAGFSRKADSPHYFIFCGKPNSPSTRWYLNVHSEELTRVSANL